MSDAPIVREANSDDDEPVAGLLEAAFGRPDEARLVTALASGGDLACVHVAEWQTQIVGVSVLSALKSPGRALALGPLAVAETARNRRIGHRLGTASLDWAEKEGWHAVFVLGKPATYQRMGFSQEAAAPFETVYPAEFMLARELKPGALAEADQRLRYAPAFATLS